MKTLISLIFSLLFFTNAFTQSFYPIERNKSRLATRMRSNEVKQKSKYVYNNTKKILEEQITYNKIGQPVLVKNIKSAYTSITQYKYDQYGKLTIENTKALGNNFLKALSIKFPDNNNGFLVPPKSKGGEINILYKYNEKNQLTDKEIVINYFGTNASKITGTEKYHILNEYDEESFIAAYYLINDKKIKFKESLKKKDTVQYNFIDAEGNLMSEEIYDIQNKIYLQKKYIMSDTSNEPSYKHFKYFKKDYRLFKEEKYLKEDNNNNYFKRNIYLMYDSYLDIADIVEMDGYDQVIKRIRHKHNGKGLLINQDILNANNDVKKRIEYVYEYYK